MLARLSTKMRHVAARVTDLERELTSAVEAEQVGTSFARASPSSAVLRKRITKRMILLQQSCSPIAVGRVLFYPFSRRIH